jgi:hypothetical protein
MASIPSTRRLPKRDRDKLERALCALVDFEGAIYDAAGHLGISSPIGDICRVLRLLVDGES